MNVCSVQCMVCRCYTVADGVDAVTVVKSLLLLLLLPPMSIIFKMRNKMCKYVFF